MDVSEVLALIHEFCEQNGLAETSRALRKDSDKLGVKSESFKSGSTEGNLIDILDEYASRRKQATAQKIDVANLFPRGDSRYVKSCWATMDALTGGANILNVQLFSNGRLVFTAADKCVYAADVPLPIELEQPPSHPITTKLNVSKAAILAVALHPKHRNIAVLGSMDRSVFLINLAKEDNPVISKFEVHEKFVTHCQWFGSGEVFVTGSHDMSLCFFKSTRKADNPLDKKPTCGGDDDDGDKDDDDKDDDEDNDDFLLEFELFHRMEVMGAVECMTLRMDTQELVVGCRGDNFLRVFTLDKDEPSEVRAINLNALGDNHVSFIPMCLSFSPDEKTLLVATDKVRCILLEWESGQLIADFYGTRSDEYSHPKICWHPSGLYIYGTSQDRAIYVWEVRTQKIVDKLLGHTDRIRGLSYNSELGMLASCGFDGTIRLWLDQEPSQVVAPQV